MGGDYLELGSQIVLPLVLRLDLSLTCFEMSYKKYPTKILWKNIIWNKTKNEKWIVVGNYRSAKKLYIVTIKCKTATIKGKTNNIAVSFGSTSVVELIKW